MKRFDVHVKTIDGVHQQTILGAVTTIVSVIIVNLLVISEVKQYLKKDIVNHMAMDNTVGVDAVKVYFDVHFHSIDCERLSLIQEITRGTLHEQSEVDLNKAPWPGSGGCRAYGQMSTDKVAGNFRFIIGRDSKSIEQTENFNQPGYDLIKPPDISHTVNALTFIPTDQKNAALGYERMQHILKNYKPLDGTRVEVTEGTGMYHYNVQVVQTEYRPLHASDGAIYNQYAVNEKEIQMARMFEGVSVGGQVFKDIVAVVFSYDFYPVMLVMEETTEGLLPFLCGLCGIVGGVITVLGLIERVLYSSGKALIGKKD